jgi:hypothetical protein
MISTKKSTANQTGAIQRVSDRQLLIAIFVLAVALRLFSAFYQGNQVTAMPGIWDQLSYDGLAQRVVAGHGFNFGEDHWPATRANEPTAHWSYLYTLFLAAVYTIFGYQPLVARIIQALIAGVLQTWFTWRIGRRIFGPKVGLLAAGLSAIYIYFFYYGGSLLTESFYFVGILWTLDAALRIVDNNNKAPKEESKQNDWWLWLELGLAIGLTVLLRQVFMFFVPVLFLWIWWNRQRSNSQRPQLRMDPNWPVVRGLTIATLVVALLILPWTIRNYSAFGTIVPLNTNAGFAFFWGNHPIHGTSFIPLLGEHEYHDLIPTELLPLNEAELDRSLLERGFGFATEQPIRFLLLSLSRTKEFFKFWPTAESGSLSNLARIASFGLALPFMLYGLWLSARHLQNTQVPNQRAQIMLLFLFAVVYAGLHLVSWALIRYRLPIDTVLIIFAGLGIADIVDFFRVRNHTSKVYV